MGLYRGYGSQKCDRNLRRGMLIAAPARAEPGVTAGRIVFGQSAALDGPAAELGQGIRQGIMAAFDQVNATGGIHGRTLELIFFDDGHEPEQAIANVTRLIEEDEVFAVIGEVGTPTGRMSRPEAVLDAPDPIRRSLELPVIAWISRYSR